MLKKTICKSHWFENRELGYEAFTVGENDQHHMVSELHVKHVLWGGSHDRRLKTRKSKAEVLRNTASTISCTDFL